MVRSIVSSLRETEQFPVLQRELGPEYGNSFLKAALALAKGKLRGFGDRESEYPLTLDLLGMLTEAKVPVLHHLLEEDPQALLEAISAAVRGGASLDLSLWSAGPVRGQARGTLLHVVAGMGQMALVKSILAMGNAGRSHFEIDALDVERRTPLQVAGIIAYVVCSELFCVAEVSVKEGHADVSVVLVEEGATVMPSLLHEAVLDGNQETYTA